MKTLTLPFAFMALLALPLATSAQRCSLLQCDTRKLFIKQTSTNVPFSCVLTSKPATDMVVEFESDGRTLSLSTCTLTFTPSNYNTPQTIFVNPGYFTDTTLALTLRKPIVDVPIFGKVAGGLFRENLIARRDVGSVRVCSSRGDNVAITTFANKGISGASLASGVYNLLDTPKTRVQVFLEPSSSGAFMTQTGVGIQHGAGILSLFLDSNNRVYGTGTNDYSNWLTLTDGMFASPFKIQLLDGTFIQIQPPPTQPNSNLTRPALSVTINNPGEYSATSNGICATTDQKGRDKRCQANPSDLACTVSSYDDSTISLKSIGKTFLIPGACSSTPIAVQSLTPASLKSAPQAATIANNLPIKIMSHGPV